MKIEVVHKFPVGLKSKGYAVAATASWGFTPLWVLVRNLYGFDSDELIKNSMEKMPSKGINLVAEISPLLLLVEKTKDPIRMQTLAKELAREADQLGIENLVLDNFRMVHTKLKKNLLTSIMRSFLEIETHTLKKIYIFVDRKNYLPAFDALKEIYPDIDTYLYLKENY